MFGLLRRLVGEEEEMPDSDMVGSLERSVSESDGHEVDKAARLRNNLRRNACELSHDDKIRIVKALNKAKVKALMKGTQESFSEFASLNSISSDVVLLL